MPGVLKRPDVPMVGRFRAVGQSDPAFERDHVRIVNFYSPALSGRGDVSLFAPPGHDTVDELPVIILLHGAFGSHWDWFWRGGAHLTALDLIRTGRMRPMVIATPSDGLQGDGTGYMRLGDADFESWICDDVYEIVGELFPRAGRSGPRFIAGLSMGGYGALRMGAKHAAKFRGISGHSSATRGERVAHLARDPEVWNGLPVEEVDVVPWMERNRGRLPRVRFDCGTEDFLIDANRALHGELERLGIAHHYAEYPGGHTWDYWQTHVAESFLFFENILAEGR